MQINAVTAPVMSALVLYAAASQAPTGTALIIEDCEALNALGNCYACNKPGHMKRDCFNQTQARTSYNGGQKIEVNCYNCNKRGHMARDCRLPKKNKGMGASMTTEIKKICQEMMVKRNKKPVDFQYRKQLTDNPRGLGRVATRRQ